MKIKVIPVPGVIKKDTPCMFSRENGCIAPPTMFKLCGMMKMMSVMSDSPVYQDTKFLPFDAGLKEELIEKGLYPDEGFDEHVPVTIEANEDDLGNLTFDKKVEFTKRVQEEAREDSKSYPLFN